ncbi:MAG: hypothetical protein HWE12_07440 [Oceanospirillaceae bacterium]|nr:hypothetical protein [Oceanospirillaceae bacterium]
MNTFKAKLTKHAQLDAIPLRYGVIAAPIITLEEAQRDDISTERQKPAEISAGNTHYLADAYDEGDNFLFRGRFVLKAINSAEADYIVITVLAISQSHADRAVSEIVKAQRESGVWSSEFIRETLHPLYISDQIGDSTELFNKLVEMVSRSEIEDSLAALERLETIILEHEDRVRELELINHKYREKIFSLERNKPGYANEDLELTDAFTLSAVDKIFRTKRNGDRVECVRLIFSESVPDRIMDVGFDQNGEIFSKASGLVGLKVKTVTWKPHSFAPMRWFRDVYPA